MSRIIPRDLIKHLEWVPGNQSPPPRIPPPGSGTGSAGQSKVLIAPEFAKYIQVGIKGIRGNQVVISPYELDGYNNMNYDDTHTKLLESGKGIYMPTPTIFTTHVKNIIAAKNGDRKLLYADETEVSSDVVEDMFKHITRDHRDIYNSGNAGAWTWLNARFVEGIGFNGFNIETVVGFFSEKEKKSFELISVPLEECLWENCWTNTTYNSQGLVASGSKSSNQRKIHGETMYFWYPRKNTVARFDAYSGGAGLYYVGDPADSGSGLGVFACAEGTASQKTGGSE